MFILNPDQYSLPCYRIGPFTTRDVARNSEIFSSCKTDFRMLDSYLEKRFGHDYMITFNGREALNIAIGSFGFNKEDIISIITTSQNFYISSCVTKEIEKFCRWNREPSEETRVFLVNHEFGYCKKGMNELSGSGKPLIEDCCTAFFSDDDEGKVGKYGGFSAYSFSKFFPLQLGGLLVNNTGKEIERKSVLDKDTELYIKKVMSYYLENETKITEKRAVNYRYAADRFAEMGLTERFVKSPGTVPSVLMLSNHGIVRDLQALKIHLWAHGIQSSIFYGEDAFFIPSHQNLEEKDIDYFAFTVKSFIEKQ